MPTSSIRGSRPGVSPCAASAAVASTTRMQIPRLPRKSWRPTQSRNANHRKAKRWAHSDSAQGVAVVSPPKYATVSRPAIFTSCFPGRNNRPETISVETKSSPRTQGTHRHASTNPTPRARHARMISAVLTGGFVLEASNSFDCQQDLDHSSCLHIARETGCCDVSRLAVEIHPFAIIGQCRDRIGHRSWILGSDADA